VTGVKLDKVSTENSDKTRQRCAIFHTDAKKQATGVVVAWRTPKDPLPDFRKSILANQKDCTDADLPGVQTDSGFQLSCTGYKKSGSFSPRAEWVFVTIGPKLYYCEVYTDPSLKLAADADAAREYCMDQLGAISS
jgi:hypothetical protein